MTNETLDPTDRADACTLLGLDAGYIAVPVTPTAAMLRPFYECPPEELFVAWDAMLAIVRAMPKPRIP